MHIGAGTLNMIVLVLHADPNFVYNSGCNTIYNPGSSVR